DRAGRHPGLRPKRLGPGPHPRPAGGHHAVSTADHAAVLGSRPPDGRQHPTATAAAPSRFVACSRRDGSGNVGRIADFGLQIANWQMQIANWAQAWCWMLAPRMAPVTFPRGGYESRAVCTVNMSWDVHMPRRDTDELTFENTQVLNLVQAMLGSVSPNMRAIS